ncbi:hypothetical protein S40288_07443 [Stachybotrys chartarum IBT 40288]|nr:hypothetical protein S40288_07443 [Stachybotrys chartarum IBT 40288]
MSPVDCAAEFDATKLAGKTAVVTGGAAGLGKAYVEALVSANAIVCFGDKNVQAGEQLAATLPNVKFVPCDVTQWKDQFRLFQEAAAFSPSGHIHFVVANAGVALQDDIFAYDDGTESAEPNLAMIDVNLKGVLYTVKLSLQYFVRLNGKEPSENQEDTCLVLASSGAGYLDCPRGPQYSCTKWAIRGIMHSLRRTTFFYGSRVNIIAPWYVRTEILSKEDFDHVESTGVQFATTEDAGQCLLHLLSDVTINGRALFVSARKWAPKGYMDLDLDDYHNDIIDEIQKDQIKPSPISLGLFTS